MSALIKPGLLKQGANIAVVSPAGTIEPVQLAQTIDRLKAKGYGVRLGKSVYKRNGYLAGSDEERVKDLHWAFESHEIDMILCARGGYGSARILELVNPELLRNNPKILVGYSDITALLLAIYRLTGLVAFHGPMASDLFSKGKENQEWFFKVVSQAEPLVVDLSESKVLRPGRVRGKLLGGNLSLICHMVGTPFLPSLRGGVLFLEDRGEAPYRIDRMLTQLIQSGLLDGIKAILIGEFCDCGPEEEITSLFEELADRLDCVLISGFPVGHGKRNLLLPLGLEAELDTEAHELRFLESHIFSPKPAGTI